MGDVFDNEVNQRHRERLWGLIRATPSLIWQIVTKRIGNAPRMLPADWGDGWRHVWLITTVVTQGEVDRDIPKLLDVPAAVRGISVEPQLEAIKLDHCVDLLDWVICGGESGSGARPFDLGWARRLRDCCGAAGVAFFMKQVGANPIGLRVKHPQGEDPQEWPADLRVREFPAAASARVVGSAAQLDLRL